MKFNGKSGWTAAVAMSVVAAATWAAPAQAATVIYEDVDFLVSPPASGTSIPGVGTKVSSFDIFAPGTYQATLTDFSFPQDFSMLGLSITSFVDNQMNLGSIFGEGTFTFTASGAGKYYANILGTAGDTYGVGLFGVQVSALGEAVVPLPPAVLFLVSGLAVFAAFGRGGKRLDAADDIGAALPRNALPA